MKTAKHSRKTPLVATRTALPPPRPSSDQDKGTRFAFYFLMGTLAAGLLYFLLVPFFI